MRYLVTGATGFIGGHLCRALLGKGEVLAMHRPNSSLLHLEGLPVERVVADLDQPETLEKAMQDVDIVFHTAAPTSSLIERGQIYTQTVEGTRAVMQAAKHCGVQRVVHTSSVSALGIPVRSQHAHSRPAPMNEYHTWSSAPELWTNGYTKYLAELEVQKQAASGLDAVIVNPALVMGREDYNRQSSSPIMQMKQGAVPFMVRGGLNVIHIDDVVAGHLLAAEKGRSGHRYILAGENLTHVQFLKEIADALDVSPPLGIAPTGFVRGLRRLLKPFSAFVNLPVSRDVLSLTGYYFYYDNRKAQVELGLAPPKSAREAIDDAVAWFREMGAL